ncbi:MAG: hypothetical protein HYV35_03975 [Lentisphaerae bacterium]|nr:hypothetical protein [Lentisphaerota bacterium]
MKPARFLIVAGWLFWALSAFGAGLGVAPTNINRTIWAGQNAGSNQFEVWNTNGVDALSFTNTLSYTNCGIYTNWITVTPGTGVSYGEHQGVWVQMVTTGLPPRTNAYQAFVQVAAGENTTNTPQQVEITMLVQGATFVVAPANLAKVVSAGQGTVWDILRVANTGALPHASLSYTVTATSTPTAWLSASPTNGVVQDATNEITVGYTPAGLSAGWYTGTVTVVALNLTTQVVEVVLRVNNKPGISWNATNKVWTNAVLVGNGVASTTVEVWNSSAAPVGQMNYLLSANSEPLGWVSVSPSNGVSTGDHQVATVSYATAGLSPGVYTGELVLSGTDVATGEATTNGPLRVGLQLTIEAGQTLQADKASLSQTILQGYGVTSTIAIWNGGDPPRGGMQYSITPDVSWVSLSPAVGVVTNATNSVAVIWATGSLAAGTNSGNLVVDAIDAQTGTRAGNAPLTIPVTLIITRRTPLNLELPTVTGTLYVGQTVGAKPGLWLNQQRITFSYQWERAATRAGGSREVLSGATNSTYVVTTADRGKYLRVDVTAIDGTPTPLSSTANSIWVDSAKIKALHGDFNGDGISDLWFYDETSGFWAASFSATSSAAGFFGGPGMTAVPGDYNGDGYEDVGVYESANGMWHILYLPRGESVSGSLFGGTAAEAAATPLPGDYDGDGATDVGLYYQGYWAMRFSSNGTVNVVTPFADAGAQPMVGDWDGNGVSDLGAYKNGVWTIRDAEGNLDIVSFGGVGNITPAVADYDGDGSADLGVYDLSANQWRWRSVQTGIESNASFGTSSALPLPGYYDHDRQADWAQARLSTNLDFIVWEVKRTMETSFPYRGQSYQQSTGRWRVSW